MTRITVIFAALIVLLGTTGCNFFENNTDETSSQPTESSSTSANQKTPGVFSLSYSSQDSLNPFEAETAVNLEICSLLYDGLTKLDDRMMPKNSLASSVDRTSPLTLTAVLRSGVKFSDGSSVTASDVVSSFSMARKSQNYKVLLSNIKSAKAETDKKIVFVLNSPDPNAAACLSFPVIKEGTASKPIGSGRYYFKDNDSPVLKPNSRNGIKPKIQAIHLLDIPDGDAMRYALESGNISYYFTDLAGGRIPQTSSASISVPLNSLVFVGVNSSRSDLSKKEVRLALSLSINRDNLCASAFAGRARAAVSPFNPSWAIVSKINGFKSKENIEAAVAQLELAGYNDKSTVDNVLTLELLVGKENSFRIASAELFKKQLAKSGIKINVAKLSHSDLVKRLKSRKFDLYIGEIKLPINMSLEPFLTSGGSASYGIKTRGESAEAYSEYMAGDLTLQEFVDVFSADVPFIPLCWRNGMAAFNRALSGVTATEYDVYYGLENWVLK